MLALNSLYWGMKRTFAVSLVIAGVLATLSAHAPSAFGDAQVVIRHADDLGGAAARLREAIPRLKRILRDRTGLNPEFSFTAELVRDRQDFVHLSGGRMYAALAIPSENLIILDLSQMRVHPATLELMALHEMCHLVLHKSIEGALLPKWLDEGIAQWVSGGVSEIFVSPEGDVLEEATLGGRLLDFAELEKEFPAQQPAMTLAYAQSRSMVEYLEAELGEMAVRGILTRLSQGGAFREILVSEYGVRFNDIERRWRWMLKMRYGWVSYLSDHVYVLVFLCGAALLILGFLRLRRRIREYPDDEESPPDQEPDKM